MASILHVEFFDSDSSSYIHRLRLPLRHSRSFRIAEQNILEVEHEDGTTRSVPLLNAKQYYEEVPANQAGPTTVFVVLHDKTADTHSVPAGMNVELIDLDAIADNPAVRFQQLSRKAKELIADEYAYMLDVDAESGVSRCGSCERIWTGALLKPLMTEREAPEGQIPSGQCPVCDALCYPTLRS